MHPKTIRSTRGITDAKEHYERSKGIRGNSLESIYVGQPFTHFCDRIGKNSQKGTMVSRFGEINAMFFTSDRRR
jgi:hypothetical protein